MEPMPLAESNDLGDRLGRALGDAYHVERELGGGGMSRVFLVNDLALERKIVLKVLPPELAAGLSVDRFKREVQLAASFQHPHIVPVLSAGAKDGLLYYAMPFITGESLRARLSRQHELPIHDAVRILRDVVDALSHAHANGVVHRDIKPDNILLAGHHALVTDFGVSKALSNSTGESNLTSVGIALGTPAYMSPEQAAADPSIDHRADIYSVGALAYELLTGRAPFTGLSPQQILAAHVNTVPDQVSLHREQVPPALAAVVMRCLEKKPADRWQSADELLAHLEALATPSGGLTPTGTTPHYARGLIPWRIVAGVATVLLLAGGAGWWITRVPAPLLVTSTLQVTNSPGLELDAAISPDGKLVAYGAGPIGRTRIFVRQIGGGAARALVDSAPLPQRTPRWSANGTQITFVVGQALYVVPAFGGTARQLMNASGYEYASPALSPDGSTIAFARQDGIYLRQASGGGGEATKLVTARWPSYLVWSGDGRRIAYVSDNPWFVYSGAMLGNIAPSTVWVADVAAKRSVAVTDGTKLNAAPVWLPGDEGLLFVSSLGGSRDIYQVALSRGGGARGAPARLTTGVNAHTISLSADGSRLAYTVLAARSNVWWAPLSSASPTPFSAAKPITNENQSIEGLSVSPDGKWVAFDSDRDGHQHIFKVPVAGGEPVQLTRDSVDDFNPSWSGDGRFIAYHSMRTGNRDVYVMTPDGGDVRAATAYPSHEMGAAASPDGGRLMYISDRSGRWEMYAAIRTPAGAWSEPRQLTRDFGYRGRWSPDGRRVAYVSLVDTTLKVVDADGTHERLLFDGHALGLTPQNAAFGYDPGIVYFAATDRQGKYAFYALPLSGGTPRPVLTFDDPLRQPRRPEFDTDGRRLFFTLVTDESDVWVMELRAR